MEPQISDTKAKPMRYAGFLSFLEKFIFVPNQSIQVWRLKFLIPAAFLIMAVAVGIQCDPDDLCEAKRIESLLDSCTEDYCKIEIPGVNYSGFNNHQISLPEHNTGKVESVVYLPFCPNRSDPIRRSKCSFSGPGDFSSPYTQYTQFASPVAEQEYATVVDEIAVIGNILGPNQSHTPISMAGMKFQSAIYKDESAQVPISRHGGHLDERESTPAQDTISRHGRRLDERESTPAQVTISRNRGRLNERESTPAQDTISRHGMRLDERESTPAQVSLLNLLLGPNQSDPVWQLRLLTAFSFVVHASMGVLTLPRDLQGVHATYQRVMLITSFGVPIFVAVITLLVSIWLVPDPSGRSNWITGLSVANFSLLGGRLLVYWMINRGTENKLRGEEIELMREVV